MTVDDILQWLADHFEHPCNYTFDDVDVPEFIFEQDPDYCETHCDNHNVKECWRKYLELYFKGMKDGAMPDTESTRLKKARKEARRFKRKYTNLKAEYERYRASMRVKKYKVVKLNKLILKQRNQTDRKG